MLTVFAVSAALVTTQEPDPATFARRCFLEARWICDDDNGSLWGKNLLGPMVFVDPRTRRAYASERPPAENFREESGVFVGQLPDGMSVANTAVPWGGRQWTMVMWPLPENRLERARLMAHELWHRIQGEIGLPGGAADNSHLDTMKGRMWLQMEVRALASAFGLKDGAQATAVRDALRFRAYRQHLFPNAKKNEERMEFHEGLAEYTGFVLRGSDLDETCAFFTESRLKRFDGKDSYSGSFAYDTGTAYGLLLDQFERNKKIRTWRSGLKPGSSFTDLLARRIGVSSVGALASTALQAAPRYGYAGLLKKETARERLRAAKEARYVRMLVSGPVLRVPFFHMNFSFDPYRIFPMGKLGRVYEGMSVEDSWGRLTVTSAALMSPDFSHLTVPAPQSSAPTDGDGWKLELKPGWSVVRAARKGDFTIARKD